MKKMRLAAWALTGIVLLIAGCVELAGQRIAFRYDAAKDQLQFLILYDGIHEKNGNAQAVPQLEEFAKNGDILLLDWPFHLEFDDVKKTADSPDIPPAMKELSQAIVKSIVREPVGSYRDADGQIGAAQCVTISDAKAFIKKVNAAANETIVREGKFTGWDETDPVTRDMIKAAAKADYQWLGLDGQALTLKCPASAQGVAKAKAMLLKGAGDAAKEGRPNPMIQFLASTPISVIQEGNEIRIRVGDSQNPTISRMRVHDEYNANLEEGVKKAAPADLDKELAARLIAGKDGPSAALNALAQWGPIEDKARALVSVAGNPASDAPARAVATTLLADLATKWNREQGMPPAPTAPAGQPIEVNAWNKWCHEVAFYPLESAAK